MGIGVRFIDELCWWGRTLLTDGRRRCGHINVNFLASFIALKFRRKWWFELHDHGCHVVATGTIAERIRRQTLGEQLRIEYSIIKIIFLRPLIECRVQWKLPLRRLQTSWFLLSEFGCAQIRPLLRWSTSSRCRRTPKSWIHLRQ